MGRSLASRARRERARRIASRVQRAVRALRCPHTGGLVYEARRSIDDREFEFSRCDCGHTFTWFERKAER